MKLRKPVDRRAVGVSAFLIVFALFIEFVIITLAAVPVMWLPNSLPINATVTQVLTTTTQPQEISKMSALVLTVEGVLLGLSPILFDKIQRKSVGVISVTVTAIALIVSLITIALADSPPAAVSFYSLFRSYFIAIALFGMVVNL